MANSNTVVQAAELPGAAQGASSTSEIQFKNGLTNNAVLSLHGAYLKNSMFVLRATGRAVGGTTTNLTVRLYDGASLGSVIFTSGAIAVNSTSANWFIEAMLLADSVSLKLQGLGYGQINATAVAQAATTAVTGVSFSAVHQFSASLQFSASDAGNQAFLDRFELEIV